MALQFREARTHGGRIGSSVFTVYTLVDATIQPFLRRYRGMAEDRLQVSLYLTDVKFVHDKDP